MDLPIDVSSPLAAGSVGTDALPDIQLNAVSLDRGKWFRKREIVSEYQVGRAEKAHSHLTNALDAYAHGESHRQSRATIAALHFAAYLQSPFEPIAGEAALSGAMLFIERSRPITPGHPSDLRGIYRSLDAAQRCLDFAARVAEDKLWTDPSVPGRLAIVQGMIDDARTGTHPMTGRAAAALRGARAAFERNPAEFSDFAAADIVKIRLQHALLLIEENPDAALHHLQSLGKFTKRRFGLDHPLNLSIRLEAAERKELPKTDTADRMIALREAVCREADAICKALECVDDTNNPLYVRALWHQAQKLEEAGDSERSAIALDLARAKLLATPSAAAGESWFVFTSLLDRAIRVRNPVSIKQICDDALQVGDARRSSGLHNEPYFLVELALAQRQAGGDVPATIEKAIKALDQRGALYTESGYADVSRLLKFSYLLESPECWIATAKQLVDIADDVFPSKDLTWRSAEARTMLCEALHMNGHYAESAAIGLEALERLCCDGQEPPAQALSDIYLRLCGLNIRLGRFKDALECLEHAPDLGVPEMTSDEDEPVAENPGMSEIEWLRRTTLAAKIHSQFGGEHLKSAYLACEDVLARFNDDDSELHVDRGRPSHANALLLTAEIVIMAGKPAGAVRFIEEAAEIFDANPIAERSQGAFISIVRGRMHVGYGDHQLAVAEFTRALERMHTRGERGFRMESVYRFQSESLQALGRTDEAEAALVEAEKLRDEFGPRIRRIVPIE